MITQDQSNGLHAYELTDDEWRIMKDITGHLEVCQWSRLILNAASLGCCFTSDIVKSGTQPVRLI